MSTTVHARRSLALLQAVRALRYVLKLSTVGVFRVLKGFFPKLMANPQVAELLRFIFLGTVVETTRQIGTKAVDFAKHCKCSSC